jgi:hypothetical protein
MAIDREFAANEVDVGEPVRFQHEFRMLRAIEESGPDHRIGVQAQRARAHEVVLPGGDGYQATAPGLRIEVLLPEPLARPHLRAGRLVVKRVARPERVARPAYAWNAGVGRGQALQWWLGRLEDPRTRTALLDRAAPSSLSTRIRPGHKVRASRTEVPRR